MSNVVSRTYPRTTHGFFFLPGYFTFGPVSIEVGTNVTVMNIKCDAVLVSNCVVVMYDPRPMSRMLDRESYRT
jgi:hypothetical protein